METRWVYLCFLAAAASTLAQGQMDFSNYKPGHGIDAPVYDADGTTALGDQFLGQLYIGTTASTLLPVGTPAHFRNLPGTSSGSGYIVAGAVHVTGLPGQTNYVELRAWPANAGDSFEAAVSAGVRTGRSWPIPIAFYGPPVPPPPLSGLRSFSLVDTNLPPVSGGFSAATLFNQPLLIPYASLLEPIHRPEGQPVHIVTVGDVPLLFNGVPWGTAQLSTNGALVIADGARATYIPNQDFVGADRFSYVVADNRNIPYDVYAQIAVLPPGVQPNAARSLTAAASGEVTFSFAGLPGRSYEVQRAPAAIGPWEQVGELTIRPDGNGNYVDPNPLTGSGFYRTLLIRPP